MLDRIDHIEIVRVDLRSLAIAGTLTVRLGLERKLPSRVTFASPVVQRAKQPVALRNQIIDSVASQASCSFQGCSTLRIPEL
jgi:hypothetical protein